MTASPEQLSPKTLAEIHSQPELWRRALDLGDSGLPGLPVSGERVLMLGCGTSYYVGVAYAELRERAGQGVTDAIIASELGPRVREYDRVVAISRSGTSSELVDAVVQVRKSQPQVPVTVLLGEQGTPLGELADTVVDLSFADEESVVQTRFPTTQLVLLRADLARQLTDPVPLREYLGGLPDAAQAALAGALPDSDIRQLVILATGWGAAVGQEAALKVREAAGAWTESYPVGEYRHGPVATCGPGTLVWGLDRLPGDIADSVEEFGGRVENGCGEPLVELVRLHRFAVQLATRAGRDADSPWHLSRSVVLTDGAPA